MQMSASFAAFIFFLPAAFRFLFKFKSKTFTVKKYAHFPRNEFMRILSDIVCLQFFYRTSIYLPSSSFVLASMFSAHRPNAFSRAAAGPE